MDALAADEVYVFQDFRLHPQSRGLFRADEDGALVPVAIGSRGLDILTLLVTRHGELVSKDEIMTAVWPGAVVEDSNLPTQISALRRILDRGRPNGNSIQTVSGRGYRFVAPVTYAAADAMRVASPLGPEAAAGLPTRSKWAAASRRHRIARVAIAAAGGAALLLAAVLSRWPTIKLFPTPDTAGAMSNSQPFITPRLSIVVLPFANLSDDPDQQYFADGLTDDLTTDLSRIPDMFVIARNTAFTYRTKLVDAKQIGRELGVRYLFEGSVQRSGSRVRINAQLIDAESDAHLWADRLDGDSSDLFALQNDVARQIAVALNLELLDREAARPATTPDAQDYILRARAVYLQPLSREVHANGVSLLERALALDPHSAEAKSYLATALAGRVLANMTASAASDLKRAQELTEQGLETSPRSPLAHLANAYVLRAQHRCTEAIPEYETVLASDRNRLSAYFGLGQCKLLTGSIDEAIPLIERAIRLSPRDPALGVWYQQIGDVHLLQSHTDEAVAWLEKARGQDPAHSMIRADLAAAYGLTGDTHRAAVELADARRL